jgi:N-acetyl-gamma-glutamyl-phosphate reductase
MKVGVIGASGYVGIELLRLCAGHGDFSVAVATANVHAGDSVAEHTPSLAGAYPNLRYEASDPSTLSGLDVVFVALPHGQSQDLIPHLVGQVGAIVDLAADFRLHDAALYPKWYGEEHRAPELLDRFVYGLPELYRDQISGATLVAAPGCYPTAATLALAPFLAAGAIENHGIIVDAASGVSGAGRAPSEAMHFGTVDENFTAYGLLNHRHTPEMEQNLGATLLFTPHLAPMTRGILATCYARPTESGLTTSGTLGLLRDTYGAEPFVTTVDEPPSTKATAGSNSALVSARVDERTGWLIALCALDNLVKGAAGQAVQCANLMLGLEETTGLALAGMYP